MKFRRDFGLDREYLQKATRHRQSVNGVAKYGHSCTGKLKLVYVTITITITMRVFSAPLYTKPDREALQQS